MDFRNVLNYFAVTAKCGHVGRRHYVEITFPVAAQNLKEAVAKVKRFSRVKKDHKDVIKNIKRISYEEFLNLSEVNKNDPYLNAKNRQEQDLYQDLDSRLIEEDYFKNKDYTFKKHNKRYSTRSKRRKYYYFSKIQEAVISHSEVIFKK